MYNVVIKNENGETEGVAIFDNREEAMAFISGLELGEAGKTAELINTYL